jgi:DNA-binding transcriptional LysR family regulator
MSNDLENLRLFIRVARTGSFSRVAREAGLSQSSVSRIISALEQNVGAALFTRNTHAVVLTDKGADYLARIEPIVDALDEANNAMRESGELRGSLRIGLPIAIAVRKIIPLLPDFLAVHPGLHVDLRMEDSYQDLVREGVDVALRFGRLADSTATSRVIGNNPRVVVASPTYLTHAGIPETPGDLAKHRIVASPISAASIAWNFEGDGQSVAVQVEPFLTVSQNEGAVAAAVAGLGIISSGLWGVEAEIEKGTLVPLLAAWTLPSVEVHAVFPAGRAAKPAARLFVDFLIRRLSPARR